MKLYEYMKYAYEIVSKNHLQYDHFCWFFLLMLYDCNLQLIMHCLMD